MTPIFAQTCVEAWMKVIEHLESTGWRDYSIVLSIASPMSLPPEDRRVVDTLNEFLQRKAEKSIQTVINTIFPVDLYVRGGAEILFRDYDRIWPELEKSKETRNWGTYFRRMTHRTIGDQTVKPLENILARIRSELKLKGTKHACYELGPCDPFLDIPVSDPMVDAANLMGSPCLSHVSLKVAEGKLLLTGFYRSHFYIERALGNLFGLAWLQYFVAKETGLTPGDLVCHSSMAYVETNKYWGLTDVKKLIYDCKAARPAQDVSLVA